MGATKFQNASRDVTTSLSKRLCSPKAGTSYTKHEVSMFTHYKDIKDEVNAKIGVVLGGDLEVTQGHRKHNLIERI